MRNVARINIVRNALFHLLSMQPTVAFVTIQMNILYHYPNLPNSFPPPYIPDTDVSPSVTPCLRAKVSPLK
jgi:hypothetical protein